MAQPSVLFVCTANQCRSPMAAALFRQKLQSARKDWRSWLIDSAGTWAYDGRPAADYSCEVMSGRGMDLSGHRSKSVTAEMLEQFDLILVMEPGHKEGIQIEFPAVANKVYLLSEMQGNKITVRDPAGQTIEAYESTANQISKMLDTGLPTIIDLVMAKHETGAYDENG